jgi:hypothetical protein
MADDSCGPKPSFPCSGCDRAFGSKRGLFVHRATCQKYRATRGTGSRQSLLTRVTADESDIADTKRQRTAAPPAAAIPSAGGGEAAVAEGALSSRRNAGNRGVGAAATATVLLDHDVAQLQRDVALLKHALEVLQCASASAVGAPHALMPELGDSDTKQLERQPNTSAGQGGAADATVTRTPAAAGLLTLL